MIVRKYAEKSCSPINTYLHPMTLNTEIWSQNIHGVQMILRDLNKPQNSFPLCLNEVWKKGKPKSDLRSTEIQAFNHSDSGCDLPIICAQQLCTACRTCKIRPRSSTENQSPETPTTRLSVGFHFSIQNNTFNVNTSSLMGSCPLSLRI